MIWHVLYRLKGKLSSEIYAPVMFVNVTVCYQLDQMGAIVGANPRIMALLTKGHWIEPTQAVMDGWMDDGRMLLLYYSVWL